MGKFVLVDARLFSGGADLTSVSNKAELASEVDEKQTTAFGNGGWKEVLGGIASSALNAEGQWEAGDPSKVDDEAWASLGGPGAWTIGPNGAAVDDLAWLLNALRASYSLGGTVGDVAPWTAKAASTWPLVRVARLPQPDHQAAEELNRGGLAALFEWKAVRARGGHRFSDRKSYSDRRESARAWPDETGQRADFNLRLVVYRKRVLGEVLFVWRIVGDLPTERQ